MGKMNRERETLLSAEGQWPLSHKYIGGSTTTNLRNCIGVEDYNSYFYCAHNVAELQCADPKRNHAEYLEIVVLLKLRRTY
jgi:hypothetical protein